MLVVVDARTLGSRPSGVGIYLNDFLKELIKYDDFKFILLSDVATSEYMKYFVSMGVEVRTQGKEIYKSAGVYSYFEFVQKQLDDIKPALFWEVNTVIPIKLKGNHKTIITIHDMFPITHMKYFGFVYSIYFRLGLARTLKHTDMILYNSNQTKLTTEYYFKNAKNIKNCISYIIFNPMPEKLLIQDKGYFLYVGNMEKRKGVDLLIEGYREYRRKGGTKNLILAGKMQEKDIDELLKSAILDTPGIEYLDYVSHDKKYELYANCSCFVFPSRAEGFGMPVIEVMKLEKPILVSNLEIYDEVAGKSINTFDISGKQCEQITKLAEGMLTFNSAVDTEAYKNAVNTFMPDKLGKKLREFILQYDLKG